MSELLAQIGEPTLGGGCGLSLGCLVPTCPARAHRRPRRVRRDTAKPNGEILRCRFSTLGVTQTDFVAGRGFTLRTFQRVLAGVPITKIALRKVAEALSLPYELAVADPGPRPADAAPACGAGFGWAYPSSGPAEPVYPATGVDRSHRPNRV